MPEGTPPAQEQQPQDARPTDSQQQPDAGDATENGGNTRLLTPAEVEKVVATRLERERKNAEARAQREREAAEAKRLEENQEFQQLAEERKKRIAELEPVAEKVERYEAALTKLLEQEKKGVPEYVQPILAKLDPVDQLTWIAENRAQFADSATAPQAPQPPRRLPPSAKPAAQPAPADLVALQEDKLRASGRYHRIA